MVVEIRGNRQVEGFFLGQEQNPVLRHCTRQRRAFFFPIRNQLIQRNRIDDGACKRVRTGLRTLLHHANADFASILFGKLLEFDGGRQTRRACADNHDIVLHTVAFDGFCHSGSCIVIIQFNPLIIQPGHIVTKYNKRPSETLLKFQTALTVSKRLLRFGFRYKTNFADTGFARRLQGLVDVIVFNRFIRRNRHNHIFVFRFGFFQLGSYRCQIHFGI